MNMTKRDFLRKCGAFGLGLAGCSAAADEYVATSKTLPPGSVGDPDNVWFGQRIYPLPHTIEDGPSCFMKDGRIVQPAREIPVFHETDVAVVGGGPAGFAAAVAAARQGARVALIERYGSLGGLFTNGMVLIMLATSRMEAGGKWTLVTRGVCGEFMKRAAALGPKVAKNAPEAVSGNRSHRQPTVDPEAAKYLMDAMVAESGVEMFFHSWGIDVVQDGDKVLGVVFQSKQGPQAVLAKQVVDATGDGDIFFAAGCGYRQITHAIGFITRLGNMDRITAKTPPDNRGKDLYGLPKPWPVRGNEANGAVWWGGRLGPQGDGLSVRDLSRAEVLHRKYWWEHVAEMQKTPGWEEIYIANTCSQIGPRATRLLDAEFVHTRSAETDGGNEREVVGWFGADGPKHAAMPVSYRSLVPKKGENVLAAGRCLGAPDTVDTFRLICPCFVTGEAAGTAAALCARKGVSPRNLPYSDLRSALSSAGVFLG
jgi:hypothetical protein